MTQAVAERIEHYQKSFFWMLAGIAVILACAYGYLLNMTIRNVVARRTAETQVAEATASISSLEQRYVSLKNSVTPELAQKYGFEEAASPKFLSREGGVSGLSFNSR